MTSGDTLCSGCGRTIGGAEILYTMQGNPVCPACHANADLLAADVRAAKNISNSAYSCLGLALLSFVFNPFFIITIMSIGSGIYALKSLGPSNERFARHVKSVRGLIYGCAIAGLAISGLRLLLIVLVLGLSAVSCAMR
jgi:hypothetical protein